MATKTFVSFDYDHDADLKTMLVGQAKNPDSPFEIADYSVKEPLAGDWQKKVKEKIKLVGLVIAICGEHTDSASGVSAELKIAQELEKEYFLLWGRSDKTCVKPKAAKVSDKMYKWTWDNLKALVGGSR
jgi:hypothetical protein